MNRWLDCIQIWHGCTLGISDDLNNFWDESSKKKLLPQPFEKDAAEKACGHDNLWTVAWIVFKSGMVVL